MTNSNTIKIGIPYIVDSEDRKKACLCAEISGAYQGTLYYEVGSEYKMYLCDDRADTFLLGLLHSAMFDDLNIVCEAGVTEQLLFQLRMYYIPILSRNMPDMSAILIDATSIKEPPVCEGAVGTGNSGGVDSYYTMLKYSDSSLENYKLTHAMFSNISTADTDDRRIRDLFEKDIPDKERGAHELGLKFIVMYSNLYSFYKHPGIYNHYFTLQYVSSAYALSKLFSTYYFSSTFPTEKFSIDKKVVHSSGRFDLFTVGCVSTRGLEIYSSGMEVERMEKMQFIALNNVVQRHLQVCSIEQSPGGYSPIVKLNCGHCNKCSRTIGILYAFGCLNEYKEIIDLSQFEKNKGKFLGRGLAADQKFFAQEVMWLLKNAKCVPFGLGFWRLMYTIRYTLSKSDLLVKTYHRVKYKN